jgi:8-oxo-dGTP diphosphatase
MDVRPHALRDVRQLDDRNEDHEHDESQDEAVFDAARPGARVCDTTQERYDAPYAERRYPHGTRSYQVSLNDPSTSQHGDTRDAMPTIVVAAALFDADGHVLMQRRPAGKAHAGLWEFPGGKVEVGEAPAEALVRELREELGIVVGVASLRPIDFAATKHVILLLFACRCWQGDMIASAADELRWNVPAHLAELPMPPLDVALAQRMVEQQHHNRCTL